MDPQQLSLGLLIPNPPLPPPKERVLGGANHLNSYCSFEWRWAVDVKSLNMAERRNSLLGQLYESPERGYEMLKVTSPLQAVKLGFTIFDGNSPDAVKEFRRLTRSWLRHLLEVKRRG